MSLPISKWPVRHKLILIEAAKKYQFEAWEHVQYYLMNHPWTKLEIDVNDTELALIQLLDSFSTDISVLKNENDNKMFDEIYQAIRTEYKNVLKEQQTEVNEIFKALKRKADDTIASPLKNRKKNDSDSGNESEIEDKTENSKINFELLRDPEYFKMVNQNLKVLFKNVLDKESKQSNELENEKIIEDYNTVVEINDDTVGTPTTLENQNQSLNLTDKPTLEKTNSSNKKSESVILITNSEKASDLSAESTKLTKGQAIGTYDMELKGKDSMKALTIKDIGLENQTDEDSNYENINNEESELNSQKNNSEEIIPLGETLPEAAIETTNTTVSDENKETTHELESKIETIVDKQKPLLDIQEQPKRDMVSNTSDIVQESNDMTNEGEKTVNASVSINDKELFIKDKKFNGENEINVENSNIKEAPQSISIGYSNILNDPEVMSKDEKNKSHEIKEYNNEKNDAQKHIEEEEINNGDIDDNEQKAVIEVENIEYSDSQGLAKVEEEMDEIIKKLKMEGENEKGIEIKQEKKEERIGTPTIKGILSKNKEIKEEKKQVSFINIPTEANTTFTSTVNTPSTIADHTPSEFYVKDNPKKWKKLALMVLREISNHRLAPLFQKPIKETVAPGYYDIVLEPIDLNKIARKIKEGTITNTEEFTRDILLMCQNALMFNRQDTEIYAMALEMLQAVQSNLETLMETDLYRLN